MLGVMVEEELSAEAIAGGLGTRLIGRRVHYYPQVTSTNTLAKEMALRGEPEGSVVVAGEQTAGRGRLQRRWHSPKGNIALTIILYPPKEHLQRLIMVASLAVAEAVEHVSGLAAQIKWPNDVLVAGRKVCGILVESGVNGGGNTYAVVGIGVNVSLRAEDYPEIKDTAVSLAGESGGAVPRLTLVRRLLVEFERRYLSLRQDDSVYRGWKDRLGTLGKKVRVTSGDSFTDGVAEAVNADGSLVLRLADGSAARIIVGDVSLRDRD